MLGHPGVQRYRASNAWHEVGTPGYHARVDHDHLLALAATLIEGTNLGAALSEIDIRPLPHIVRMFHIRELLERVFPAIWEAFPLKDGLDAEEAELMRELLFNALYVVARARGGERRRKASWTRFGDEATGTSPAESSDKDVGYALVVDPDRETAVYISGSSTTSFGQTWEWRDGGWRSCRLIEHAIAEPHKQGFRGFHDPGRQGIACWTLIADEPTQFERYRPFGLLIGPTGVEVIEGREPPVVPSDMLFVFGAIFGIDPVSGDTIMLTRDAVHALRDGAWSKVCELSENDTSREWKPESRGSFVHDGHLHFIWTDKDDFSTRCRLLRFTGTGVRELKTPKEPRRGAGHMLSDGVGARFVRRGTQWCLAGTGDDVTWQKVESAARLPKYRRAWGTVLPDGEILVGPGKHADDSGENSQYQRIFLHVHPIDGDPSSPQIDRLGEVLEGVGACPSDRVLLGHDDEIVAVHGDGRVDRIRGTEHEALATSGPSDSLDLAGVCMATGQASGPRSRHVTAVARDGSVWQLDAASAPAGWQRIGEPDAEVAAWTLACCCWDPPRDRLVVWGYQDDPDSKHDERTAVWTGGSWQRLEAGSTLPPGETYLRADHDSHMVFDTRHQAVVFVGANSVALLDNDRWHPTDPAANIYRGASRGSALLVHDEESATTLFIDTKDRWCGRLNGGELEQVGQIRAAPDKLSTFCQNAQARRAAMVYVPASRSVVIYASGASYDQYWELPLGDLFADPIPAGEEKDFERSDPSQKRFTGGTPRRAAARSDERAGSDDVVRFQHFGSEPPADWKVPTQKNDEMRLTFDPVHQRLVLTRGSFGVAECWHKTDDGWQLLHRSDGLPRMSTLLLSSDPRRGAVLWSVDDRHGTCGYRITDAALEPLATSGDGPVRGEDFDHREKLAFVWDRTQSQLLAFSTEGLWALDDDDRWTRVATWNGNTPLHEVGSFRDRDGGAWDVPGERLVMWRFDFSDGLLCWSVTEDGVTLLEEARREQSDGCFIAGSEGGVLLYDGVGKSLLRLESSGWVEIAAGDEAPDLTGMDDAVMACHGEGGLDLDIASWRPFRFYARRSSGWQVEGQPVGVVRPRGAAFLGRHHGHFFAADMMDAWSHDGERWYEVRQLMEVFFEASWASELNHRCSILAISQDGEGPARVVCESGAIAEFTGDGWTLHRPTGELPDLDSFSTRLVAFCPVDSSWLMANCEDEQLVTHRGTRDGAWQRVCELPFSEEFTKYTTRQLIFDTRLECFVLAGKDGVFHLRDGAWIPAGIAEVPECDRVVHDRETGATLIIFGYEGTVYHLGAGDITELGTIGPPESTRRRAIRTLPTASDLLFDPLGRRLLWFDYRDAWGNFELDLTGFFEQARVLGALES